MNSQPTKKAKAWKFTNKNGELVGGAHAQIETPHYFSPEELKSYNELKPDFAKHYLENVVSSPKENAKNNQRTFILTFVAIAIALVVILFLMGIILFCLWQEQYVPATIICVSALVVVAVGVLQSKK